mgnify:FL=1|jgi:2-oxo-4-hydroxy-4-carboxy-5-ureidoimidazoline decarboxylase
MINKINKLSEKTFCDVFGNVFENARWISKNLYAQRPFINFNDLSSKMLNIFEKTSRESKLKILNSHPDLADKAKIGSLTPESNKEQSESGLDKCTKKEFDEFKSLNLRYKKKFGFPFIIAVKGKTKNKILNDFKERITYDINKEFTEATQQVKKIASLRINEIIKND